MKRLRLWVLVGVFLGSGVIHADELPWEWFFGCDLRNAWQARKCWCPDDYHRKPLPCDPLCGTGYGNNHGPRICPLIGPPCIPPWYVCVPAAGGGCSHGNCASGACQSPDTPRPPSGP
jgi:hypothetical protein